jgi:hypothetical protein
MDSLSHALLSLGLLYSSPLLVWLVQKIFADGGHKIDIIKRQLTEAFGQCVNLLTNRQVLVHDKDLLPFNLAKPAFCIYAGSPKILLGNGNSEFGRYFLQLLV